MKAAIRARAMSVTTGVPHIYRRNGVWCYSAAYYGNATSPANVKRVHTASAWCWRRSQ